MPHEVGRRQVLAGAEGAVDVDEHGDPVGRDELSGHVAGERAVEVGHVAEREVELVALECAERLDEVAAHAELDDEVRLLARGGAHEPRRRLHVGPHVDAQRRRAASGGRRRPRGRRLRASAARREGSALRAR
jgi:hypothetical protein